MNYTSKSKSELLEIIRSLQEEVRLLRSSAAGSTGGKDAFARESNLLRALVDSTPDLIYAKDRKSRYVLVNRAYVEFLGKKSEDEFFGRSDFDLFPHELAAQYYSDEQQIMNTGMALLNREEPRIDAQGVTHWVLTTKTPLADRRGNIVGLVGITHDISRRKQFENDLMNERQILHTLMDNVPDSIYFKDAQSRFIRVNRAWARRRRLSDTSEVIGKTDHDFFPLELAQRYYEDELHIMATGRPLISKVEKIERPGMPTRWISITKVPIHGPNNAIVGTCGISRDITMLIHTEEKLARERDLLHTLMDYSTDHIYFKDRESRFTRLNRALAQAFGYVDPSELVGKSDFDIHPQERAQDSFDDEVAIMQTGKPLVGKIEMNPTEPREPGERWVLTSKWPLFDKDNHIVGTFGISRDITHIKRIEAELRQANTDLESRIEARTSDLKRANERLETRLSQLDFLTSATYDLAQFIEVDELIPAILAGFASRVSTSAASLSIHGEHGFSCVCAIGELDSPEGRRASERAVEAYRAGNLQRPFMVDNWRTEEYLSRISWPESLGDMPCYIAIPLLADNRSLAVVQMFTNAAEGKRYPQEEKVIATLGAHSAISLINAIHYKELGEKARLQGELDAAHSIQQSFTPHEKPSIPHVDLMGVYFPAYEVGGDYLDYYETENGDWVVVIADVCGKGIPAALLMAVLRSTFRIEAKRERSAKALLCAVNDSMKANLTDQSFITALCMIIDKDGNSMSYARAGHPMLIRILANDNSVEFVQSEGIALGLVSDSQMFRSLIDEVTIPLITGDRYFVYTDGLSEAWNSERACYGVERVSELLSKNHFASPEELLTTVMADVKNFTKDVPYHDDLTMLALQITGTP